MTSDSRNASGAIKAGCAIIVTYHPRVEELLGLIKQIASERDFLIIDNDSRNIAEFEATVRALPACVDLHRLDANQGLAAAMNIGLTRLVNEGYQFAYLFDQDSELGPDFLTEMEAAYGEAALSVGHRIAAIGPRIRNPQSGQRSKFKIFNRLLFRSDRAVSPLTSLYEADFLISSGTLIPLANLAEIGLMKDSYFIDNIDLEWCFRAKAKGFHLFGTDRAVLHHSIGEISDSYLVRHGVLIKHNPLRCYYSTRNRFDLYRKNYAPMSWKIRDFCRFTIKSLLLVLFSSERSEYWRNIRKGISDSRAVV